MNTCIVSLLYYSVNSNMHENQNKSIRTLVPMLPAILLKSVWLSLYLLQSACAVPLYQETAFFANLLNPFQCKRSIINPFIKGEYKCFYGSFFVSKSRIGSHICYRRILSPSNKSPCRIHTVPGNSSFPLRL